MARLLPLKNTIKMYSVGLLHSRLLNAVQDYLRGIKTKGSESVSDNITEVQHAHDYVFTDLIQENKWFNLKRGKMETNLEPMSGTGVMCLKELVVSESFLLPPPPLQRWTADMLKQCFTENSEGITELEECLKGSV